MDTHSYSLSYFSHLQNVCMVLFEAIFLAYSIFFPTVYLYIMRLSPPENCLCVGDLAILGKMVRKDKLQSRAF